MCYSAMQRQAEKEYEHMFGRLMRDDDSFVNLFRLRAEYLAEYPKLLKIPRGLESLYSMEQSTAARDIARSVQIFQEYEIARLQDELKKAEARIQTQQEKLTRRETKAARESYEIGLRQRAKALADLDALKRPPPTEYRFFPYQWCTMIIGESGRRLLTPARFRILPHDGERPDKLRIYNARRDSLQVRPLWEPIFGRTHAIVPFIRFFEQVNDKSAPDPDKAPKIQIAFSPQMFEVQHPQMWSASVYAEFNDPALGLIRSVAFVTDDPPQEVLNAGHDRCPVFLRSNLVSDWLMPAEKSWGELDGILAQREQAFYEHSLAQAA